MAVAFEHESLVGVVGMNIPLGNFGFVTLLRPHFLHDNHKKYEAHQRLDLLSPYEIQSITSTWLVIHSRFVRTRD